MPNQTKVSYSDNPIDKYNDTITINFSYQGKPQRKSIIVEPLYRLMYS